MSGATPELALGTAVDADDTADYLTLTLANGLRTLDALFNNITGHSHAGAHQGGQITSVPASAIPDGSITSAKIADGSITAADIADGQITSAKIADGSIATADIGDGQITSAKLAANIAISGTLSVAGATTFTGIVNAASILMTPTGVIRMGPAAAQQSGGLNLANSNPVSWRNLANTADVSMIIDSTNHLSLVGWADDGGSFTPAGAAPNALRIIINGVAWRAPLYPMP